ncbi:MAG: anti-sigma F factor [Oscillospiraceae bacterium]
MKKMLNETQITMLSRSCNESYARIAVASFIAVLDPTIDELTDIKTAVSEAVTNCIVHAYREKIGKIYITARIFDDRLISISIRDKGCGIEDVKKAMEPTYSTMSSELAGLGFSVMKAFMDKLTVRSHTDRGTSVTMVKKLKPQE